MNPGSQSQLSGEEQVPLFGQEDEPKHKADNRETI